MRNFSPSIIRDNFQDKNKVVFIQIGSNDGVQGDPLHDLIVNNNNWSGIFIEPVKFLWERLKDNYNNNNDRLIFENVAIGNQKGVAKFYFVSESAKIALGDDLPFWYDQLGSFNKNHILKHLDGKLEPFIVEEEIECVPLDYILEKNKVQEIDLIHIDVEGFDYQILRQIDFQKYKPLIILYEHKHLSVDETDKARFLLTNEGYNLLEDGGDTLAVLSGVGNLSPAYAFSCLKKG